METRTRDITDRIIKEKFVSNGNHYGIVIGINKYLDGEIPDLKCAVNDANAMYQLMTDSEYGMFKTSNVEMLTNDQCSKARIMATLNMYSSEKINKDDTFWFYFAGHALKEKDESYIAPYDGCKSKLRFGAGISSVEFKEIIKEMNCSRKVLILDCCHAQAFKTRGSINPREIISKYKGVGDLVLYSSAADQKSVEQYEHGIFTHFLVKGLMGEAGNSDDDVITAEMLLPYITTSIAKKTAEIGHVQTPAASGDFVLNFPLSVNRKYVDKESEKEIKKRKIIEVLKPLCAYDKLSRREVDICIDIIECGANNQSEKNLEGFLEGLLYRAINTAQDIGMIKEWLKIIEANGSQKEIETDSADNEQHTETLADECFTKGKGYLDIGDIDNALAMFMKAANSRHGEACYELGNIYYFGEKKEKDIKEAIKWYGKAVEQEHPAAQYALGRIYFFGDEVENDKEKAIKLYRNAVEKEYAIAQCALGDLYIFGDGVDVDYNAAARLYAKAAHREDINSYWRIGQCCYYGMGFEKNKKSAVEWYEKAAEKGHKEAQWCLGQCYYYGEGVARDILRAEKWYKKAAEQGHISAQFELGKSYTTNRAGEQLIEVEVVKWYRKAAEQGHVIAQYCLGVYYEYGEGVAKNKRTAVKWYKRAAEQGHANAQLNLGKSLFSGDGIDENKLEAVNWYRKAAEQEQGEAQWLLGECYEYGNGVNKNIAEAVKWYRRATEQGSRKASFAIGKLTLEHRNTDK